MITNLKTGKPVKTYIEPLSAKDLDFLQRRFEMNWERAFRDTSNACYKLIAVDLPSIIQGVICIEILPPVLVVALESAGFNRVKAGNKQRYKGVGLELLRYCAWLSKQAGQEGEFILESKEEAIQFYTRAGGDREAGTNYFKFSRETATILIRQL